MMRARPSELEMDGRVSVRASMYVRMRCTCMYVCMYVRIYYVRPYCTLQ